MVSVPLSTEKDSIPGKEAAAAGLCREQLYDPPGSSKQRSPLMTARTITNMLGRLCYQVY